MVLCSYFFPDIFHAIVISPSAILRVIFHQTQENSNQLAVVGNFQGTLTIERCFLRNNELGVSQSC